MKQEMYEVPKMNSDQRKKEMYKDKLVYLSRNVYSSPRVSQQKIDHTSNPLCIYTGPIQANNVSKYFDQKSPQVAYLRPIKEPDGLIHQFSMMNKIYDNPPIREKLQIKILICICMYNESKNAINLTLTGIYKNLKRLEQEGFSPEEIGVVLIQDGILKLVSDRKTRKYAKGKNSMVEFYRELDRLDGKPRCDLEERINIILEEIDNFNKRGLYSSVQRNNDFPPTIEKNIALLYQNLWKPSMTDEEALIKAGLGIEGSEQPYYLKLFSCFKHLNGTKLSSHLWFFEGFCRYLDPKFIVLLDVGTQPNDDGLVNLIRGFYTNSGKVDDDVGGCTGLMSVDSNFPSQEGGDTYEEQQGCIKKTFFSIQRAQEYQYIISHFIDKNAEGALGFLHVLPGAWSAYRYRALIKSDEYQPNLLQHSYFKTTLTPDFEWSSYQEANMYLAEDRILSLGIYCQPKSQYYLKYVPDAGARTDPMKSHQDLMKQRRRWINSSLFAFLYVWKNYYYNASESNHNCFNRYFKLNLSMILALLSFATSYFIPSLYFYVLYASIAQIDLNNDFIQIIAKVIALLYVILYLIAIAGGLSGSVWTKHAQNVSRVFAIITFSLLGLVSYNIVAVYLGLNDTGIDFSDFNQMSILVMLGINLVGYFLVVFMHCFAHCGLVWKLISDTFSYWFYQGAYSQTLVAHAFCNVDDVSWGTKGSTGSHGNSYQTDKVFFISSWLFYNALLAYICIYIDIVITQNNAGPDGNRRIVLIVIAIYGTAQMGLKLILAMYHYIKWLITSCRCCRTPMEKDRIEKVNSFWNEQNARWKQMQYEVVYKHAPVSAIVKKYNKSKNNIQL